MVNNLVLSLVNSILGQGKPTSKGNYAYVCPFHTSNPPGKKNFEINLTENEQGENKWACWGCKIKGKKLINLFNKLNVSQDKKQELKSYITNISNNEIIKNEETISLPKEFISLYKEDNNLIYRHAVSYLKKRRITKDDIFKYNLGYCKTGIYSNMIIIPSYNEKGDLNFFVGRGFMPGSNKKLKPPFPQSDIIPFEFYINWNLPIILCEGVFDAITIKRNAIPLLGKIISKKLMKKIISSSVQKIYIALDKDAIKQSIEISKHLLDEGKKVYLVDIENKDFSEMGFEQSIHLLQNTKPLTFSKLMEQKLLI